MSIIVQHRRDSRANCEANTPAAGEFWFDTVLKALRIGDGATLGGFLQKRWRSSFSVSPAQIAADQNDYNPVDLKLAETLFLASDAARTITGILAGGADARMTVVNRGAFDITLKNNATAASLPANCFLFDADVVIRPLAAIDLQYSAADSRWVRAGGGTKLSTVPQEVIFSGAITPAQIALDQNDYAPNDAAAATKTTALASILRLSSDALRNITGLVDPRDGVIKTLLNAGANPILLKNQNAGSAAANRFDFGADVTLAAKQSATIRYDGADQRWKLEAATSGSAVAAGAVTAQTLAASALGLSMINGTLVSSVAAGALTIAIKTLAGNDPSVADPVLVLFRNAAAGAGDLSMLSLTTATSLVISSGSSMGVSAINTAFRLWVVGFNDAGTFRLGAINCLSGTVIYTLDWGIASSTAEGGAGAADSAQVFYTGVAVAAKPFSILGYMSFEGGLAAAGTWAVGPTRTQLFGEGVPLPGAVLQHVRSDITTMATGTTVIPLDNTIPQNTEGDQYISKSIAPSSAANMLLVRTQLTVSSTAVAGGGLVAALFQDGVANALKAIMQRSVGGSSVTSPMTMSHAAIANTSIATTFKVRAGPSSASTMTFNGEAGSGYFNGTLNSYLEIDEVMT